MHILTIDFETYYNNKIKLGFGTRGNGQTTQEYLDDPRFHEIGVAVKINDKPSESFSGTFQDTKDWLLQWPWESSAAVAHNAMFDMSILAWRFGIYPKKIIDTLSMARALHGTKVGGSLKALAEYYDVGAKGEEVIQAEGLAIGDFSPVFLEQYMQYCRNDVELTYKILLEMLPHFNKVELELIDMTIRMHSEPMLRLDPLQLEANLHAVQAMKERLLSAANSSTSELASNQRFAELLIELGVEPPMKISPTTGKETYAFAKTDDAMKKLAEHPDVRVQALVAARTNTKSTLEESRTERFMRIAEQHDCSLPIPLRYYGAMTGRWSGSDQINMQNLPRKSLIKKGITAPDGYVIVGADLSNIELRMGLYFAGQIDKLKLLAEGKDLYKDFASAVFNVDYDEVDDAQRFIGKTSQLALIYGTGANKLRDAIKTGSGKDIGEDMAKEIVQLYRTDYASVRDLWYQGEDVLCAIYNDERLVYGSKVMGLNVDGSKGIEMPSKLYLKYPNLKFEGEGRDRQWTYTEYKEIKRIYAPKVFQNTTQALARCIMGEAMVRINKVYPVALTIHDAVYCIVPEDQAETALEFILAEMCREPRWAPGIPLGAEGKYGKSLKDC